MAAPSQVPRVRLGSVQLAARAGWALGGNDIGTMITAAPRLYPHMWSWDTAFISIGLAHLNVDRAVRELETLFAAQWRNGMLPHIVFSEGGDYFPGPRRWGTAELNRDAPAVPHTSGICQPPAHALALRRIVDIGASAESARRLLAEGWPRLYRWHEWLVRHRDPHGAQDFARPQRRPARAGLPGIRLRARPRHPRPRGRCAHAPGR